MKNAVGAVVEGRMEVVVVVDMKGARWSGLARSTGVMRTEWPGMTKRAG